MTWQRSSVVLIQFVFADETGLKRRPAVILSGREYAVRRQEVIVAAVTSNTRRILPGDYQLRDWRRGGLIGPSVVTGIVRTIKQSMISSTLGQLTTHDLGAYSRGLRAVLEL